MKQFKRYEKENLAIILAFIVMIILFYSSSQPYEKQNATSFLENILPIKPFETQLRQFTLHYAGQEISVYALGYYKFIEFFIRKFAHFISFLALGWLWLYGLNGKVNNKRFAILLTTLICIGYATFDEFHQSLTPNRTSLWQDVVLDSTGALTGIVLYIVLHIKQFKRKSVKKR